MKRILLFLLLITLALAPIRADEGMWLPLLIKERIADMHQKGFKLTAEDLYSINQKSLKDAIVHFGGGCTGELISDQGLLITNHHCGFGQIQSHSSTENDYLRDGFWAMSKEDELPNKSLTVRFLVRVEDVTDYILEAYNNDMSEDERIKMVNERSDHITARATEGTHYSARVEPLYYGNQYLLFVYETYPDVRLVGAPPSSIGKFGGDTDNWMWPRHTGDFALFRIYAGKDNKPAPYSADNVPYVPKKHFKISTNGVQEGDFTLVYGYPGRTQQYIHSKAVRYLLETSNPHKINLRTKRLNIQREEMSKSQEIRIQYASKNASVSNAWKKWQGESRGLIRLNTVGQKEDFEARFDEWAKGKPEYEGLLHKIGHLYDKLEPYSFATDYQLEAINANEIFRLASNISAALRRSSHLSQDEIKPIIRNVFDSFFKDYYSPIDKYSFIEIVSEYETNIPQDMKPKYFRDLMKEYSDVAALANFLFKNSFLASPEKAYSLLERDFNEAVLNEDPGFKLYNAFNDNYTENIRPVVTEINNNLNLLYRSYMRGQMEFDCERVFYPDANSTLRIAYGNVSGYKPSDAVYYKHYTTLDGIMEKDNPEIYDYNIPQKLRDVYASKDFGKWEVDGTVPVCFIATNHTSGGNSGSPVINAKGELIGINFDRVWEGTMSDIAFDPEMCRNITLDIRYVLFIIDKVAGANHLIDEMAFAK